jgi:hypothetical protein
VCRIVGMGANSPMTFWGEGGRLSSNPRYKGRRRIEDLKFAEAHNLAAIVQTDQHPEKKDLQEVCLIVD